MTEDDDAPEWSADVFARAEIKRGDEVVRRASGTLTKPHESMLDRAARAVSYVERRKGDAFDISDDMARDIARAVLLAVREPDERAIQAGEDGGYVADYEICPKKCFTAMIDAILNEPSA